MEVAAVLKGLHIFYYTPISPFVKGAALIFEEKVSRLLDPDGSWLVEAQPRSTCVPYGIIGHPMFLLYA